MKVLFIHNRYQQAGGEDVAVEAESRLLQEKGHQVQTIVFTNAAHPGIFEKAGAGWKAIYNGDTYRVIKKRIQEFRPDVVHVHNLFFVASPSVLFAADRLKIPVVLTVHNYRLVCANALLLRNNKPCELCVGKTFPLYGIRYRCYRSSMAETALVTAVTGIHKILGTWQKKVTRYVVLTEFAKSKLSNSSLHLQPGKFIVKPNFIADPGEGSARREDFFLFVGRLSKEKGVLLLLQAFSAMPGSRLVIIGEGPEKEFLQQQFANAVNVTFAGKLNKEEVLETMKISKALIFPSIWYEGLPFTIIESFATGTPD